jgi:Ca2+ transporting ATPase
VALCLAFIGAITKAGTPLTAVQLLWVNLIMDTMAALALGTERPTDSLLYRKPQGMKGKLITPLMWRNIVGQSIYQLGWLCAALYAVNLTTMMHLWLPNTRSSWNPNSGEHILRYPTPHYTFIFNIFVLMQAFNEINSRKVNLDINVFDGFFTNPAFSVVLIITFIIQVLIVQFGGLAFMTSGLDGILWGISIAISASTLLWGVLIRLIKVPLEDWEKVTPDVQ